MKDREHLDQQFVGGVFDWLVRIEGWDQHALQKQTVLILGVGALGTAVAINCLRLGVGRLFLIDYDVVDKHNLNRQLLFCSKDVGRPKVEAALQNSQFHRVSETQVEVFHGNALTNWQKVVEFAQRSTFVYNCIDWGDTFDMAVSSLCLHFKLPLVMGGTFSTSMTVDFFPDCGRPCYLCSECFKTAPEIAVKIGPGVISELKDISFLQKNNNPVSRSSAIVSTLCGELMVSHLLNLLFLAEEKPYKASRLIFYHNTFEVVKFDLETFKKCPFCATS